MQEAKTPIEQITAALQLSGMKAELEDIPGTEVQRTNLVLLEDHAAREIVLQIIFINDVTATQQPPEVAPANGADGDPDAGEDDDDSTIVLFSAVLPYQASAETEIELMRLLLMINRLLPIGTFGYGEADGGIFFSYPLVLHDEAGLTGLMLQEILNMTAFAIETYGAMVESVAGGIVTAAQLQADMREAGVSSIPVGAPYVMRHSQH